MVLSAISYNSADVKAFRWMVATFVSTASSSSSSEVKLSKSFAYSLRKILFNSSDEVGDGVVK